MNTWKLSVLFIALVLCMVPHYSSGQVDSVVSKIRMKYAVPDAPAFKALGIQPDEIMRPSTTQELALILTSQVLSSAFPSAFSLEFSPYLTIGGESLTLYRYQNSLFERILYHTRVSIASERGAQRGDTTRLSFGLRFTLFDDSDLRLDKTYIAHVYSFNDSLLAIESRIKDHFRGPLPSFIQLPKAQRDSVDALAADSSKIAAKALEDSITAERENAIKRNWNKPIAEVGFAVAGYSSDSVRTTGILGDQIALWLVTAGNIQEWGQWVIGANGALKRDEQGNMSVFDGSVGARVYAGSNAAKAFIGIDWKGRQSSFPEYLYQAGSELRVYEIFWVTLSAGIENVSGGGSKFTSNLDLRIGTP